MVFIYVVMVLLLLMLLVLGMILIANYGVMVFSFKFFSSSFYADLEILFNMWNFMFLMMVLVITLSVLFFSFSYMNSYPVQNFIFLYMLFVLSMFWLIMSNNFYWMMFGWDGLGVVSFLLIVFYMNYESSTNGLFTVFQNRLGDLFFVFFLVLSLETVLWTSLILKVGALFLILGASVKSAQFPFNSWLLAAMSAPTPISSLVHSSTLVVAGVYILLQFSYCLFEYLYLLKVLSLLTLVISTFGLLNETDMKKLIAYSTMSHVGLMLLMFSMQLYKITYFHLNIHAMFKSMMFMCFGFTMLSSFHGQDKRLISFSNLNPLIKMLYIFACLCLGGLPFLSAFFSKDFIIEKAMEISVDMSSVFMLLIFLGVSIYYTLKLLKLYYTVNSLSMVDFQYLGMLSLITMMIINITVVNLYISLIFSISLEIMNMKMMVYLFVLVFLILGSFFNLNYKWNSYTKFINMNELWSINWYILDQFVYSTIQSSILYLQYLNNVKFILLMNWWVMILFVSIF